MKQFGKSYIILLSILLITLSSCLRKTNIDGKNWYEETKVELLRQSNLIADSTSREFDKKDSSRIEVMSFNKQHLFLYSTFYKGIKKTETHFSLDGNFELRREICPNGVFSFEGIIYKNSFYGLSTWKFCNGNIEEQGVRFNSNKIGVWKKFDESGKQIEKIDYRKIEPVDSFPTISKR